MDLTKNWRKILFKVEDGKTLEDFLLEQNISSRLFRRVYKSKIFL